MKIKNLTVFSLAVAILCVAARTVTMLYATESGTGFFINRLTPLGLGLSAGIFVLVLAAVIFAFYAKEKTVSPFSPSALSSIASLLLGISLIFYSLGFNIHGYLILWQHALETVTGILAGLWFIAFGLSAFAKIKLPAVAAALPCIHYIMRLIVVFTSISTSALVAEHIFSLAYHVSAMVYMLNFGRIAAGEPSKNIAKVFFPISAMTFIFTCTSVFSRLIMLILGKPEMIHGEAALDITGIVLSIFVLLIAADTVKEDTEKSV